MISCLVLDLGGLVFRFDPRRRLRRLAALSPMSDVQIDGALWGSGLAEDADRGLYDARQLAAEAQRRGRLVLDYGELRDAWVETFEPDGAVLLLLDRVREDVTIASFSNNGELVRFGMEARWPAVMARFRPGIWTYEAGALKPDAAAYRHAAMRLQLPPGDVCFVDDSAENVEAARAFGWDAIHFTSVETLEVALCEPGLLGDAEAV